MIVTEKIHNTNRYSCNSCGNNPSEFKITVGNAGENGEMYGICTVIEFCGECAEGLADSIAFYLQNPVLKTGLGKNRTDDNKDSAKSTYGERSGNHEFT